MMKFCRGFSILILLCILPSFAFAVTCPIEKDLHISDPSLKECTGACVFYSCPGISRVGGCSEDFYRACSESSQSDIDFIKNKSPNHMIYIKGPVFYISGCGGEKDGKQCMYELDDRTIEELPKDFKDRNPYWKDLSSNSNGQNGAFKFIGIIAFGWILFAAARIY